MFELNLINNYQNISNIFMLKSREREFIDIGFLLRFFPQVRENSGIHNLGTDIDLDDEKVQYPCGDSQILIFYIYS